MNAQVWAGEEEANGPMVGLANGLYKHTPTVTAFPDRST
jgi:hypothetical protein